MKLDTPEFKSIFTPELNQLSDYFTKYGYELRIAGGAVRDLVMGKIPDDIDFASTATPDQMHEMFEKEQVRTFHKQGEKHGTVTCRINDKENFEITTLRVDVVCDGRRADVKFVTDWILDANRRDLTINSLFLGLDGTVYDYFGGIEDIKKRRVAFVGDAKTRIQEDYLRILRYFRFFGRVACHNWKEAPHEPETLEAISNNVAGLADVSGERLWAELKKIVTGNCSGHILRTMRTCGVWPYVALDVSDASLESGSQDRLEVFDRLSKDIKDLKPETMTLLSCLFSTTDSLMEFNKRMKISANERDLGLFCIFRRDQARDAREKWFRDLMMDEGAKYHPPAKDRVVELAKYVNRRDILEILASWELPQFPLDGYRVALTGVKKGPDLGKAIKYLTHLWQVSDYEMSEEELLQRCPQFREWTPPPDETVGALLKNYNLKQRNKLKDQYDDRKKRRKESP